jgi:type I restriction enzyme S subunit
MKVISLPEVAKIIMGQSPPSSSYNTKGEGLPFFQGKADFGDLYPTVRMFCTEPNKIAQVGDILISVRAPVGPTNLAPERCCIGRGLAAIRGSKNIKTQYLLYFLRSYEPELAERGTGSTFDAISRSDLEAIHLPLPPLDEQKRIAAILSKADRLRHLRRYARELSDGYLGSVFLEMFGDPVSNSMGWEIRPLGDSIDGFEGGVNFPPVSEGEDASPWRVLKVSAVTWGDFDPSESKPISSDVEFDPSLVVRKGDLIISRANTTALVGAVCLVRHSPPKVLLPDKLWRVRFSEDSKLLPDYTLYALRQSGLRRIIGDLATGTSGSMKNISKQKAATLPIPLAPLPLQQKFAQIVHKFERLRAQQREGERQAEHLFQSLLGRAFRREL